MAILADLAKVSFTKNDIDNYKSYIKSKTLPNTLSKRKKQAIKRNIDKYQLDVDENDDLIYRPRSIKILSPNKYDEILSAIYNDKTLGLSSGIKSFHYAVNTKYLIPRSFTEQWLKKQSNYQLTRRPMIKKNDDKIIALAPNAVWMADAMFLPKYVEFNKDSDGTPYIGLLNIIDVFSKKLWSYPIQADDQSTTIQSVADLISEINVRPKRFISDNGTSFGNEFKTFVENKGETQYIYGSPHSPTSQSQVERVQRTLRQKIRFLFVRQGRKNNNTKFNYINSLKDIVNNYNRSRHSSTGFTPDELYDNSRTTPKGKVLATKLLPKIDDNATKSEKIEYVAIQQAKKLFVGTYKPSKTNILTHKDKIEIGDYVRISMKAYSNTVRDLYKQKNYKDLSIFYTPLIYIVDKFVQKPSSIRRAKFKLKNIDGTPFQPYVGLKETSSRTSFYESELLKIDKNTINSSTILDFDDADILNFTASDADIRKRNQLQDQRKRALLSQYILAENNYRKLERQSREQNLPDKADEYRRKANNEKQLRENYMKEINKSTQKAIPSNKIRKKSPKNIKPQKQNSTIQQSSVKSPVQVQTRTGRVVKPTAKMKGQGIDNDNSTYSNQMKKLIEIIFNQMEIDKRIINNF